MTVHPSFVSVLALALGINLTACGDSDSGGGSGGSTGGSGGSTGGTGGTTGGTGGSSAGSGGSAAGAGGSAAGGAGGAAGAGGSAAGGAGGTAGAGGSAAGGAGGTGGAGGSAAASGGGTGGTGGSDGGTSTGTCANFVGSCRLVAHQCRDIGGVGNTLLFAQASCKAPSIWSTSPCPAAEAGAGTEKVGGCKYTGSTAAFYYKEADCMINWYYPPSTAPIPAVLCTGGTPIPP